MFLYCNTYIFLFVQFVQPQNNVMFGEFNKTKFLVYGNVRVLKKCVTDESILKHINFVFYIVM